MKYQYSTIRTLTKTRNRRSGMTLLEVLLVLILLATVATVGFIGLDKILNNANEDKVRIEVNETYKTGIMLYRAHTGSYPTTEEGLKVLVDKPAGAKGKRWRGPYLEKDEFNDPWGNPYVYRQPGTHNTDSFDLYSLGADGVESDDDIGNWE